MCYTIYMNKNEETKLNDPDIKEMMHMEFPIPPYPFVDTNNKQLIGYCSECIHCFQCGYTRALCTNAKCPSKFCFWSWYTAGLVPDQLCTWFEPNPRWQSVSINYFVNRQLMIQRMVEAGEIQENHAIPEEALRLDGAGEYMFKPVNIFLLGADESVDQTQITTRWPWLKLGIGKPIYKIRYEQDLDLMRDILREQITSVEGMGMIPCIVLKWDESITKEYQDAVMKLITDYESVQTVNIATRLVHSETIQENEFINFAWLNHSRWAYDLVGAFKDHTVLCIAGGPTLRDNLDLIRANQDRLVILAVSTVAELLFKEGITPHIIGTIDMKSHNRLYLDALTPDQQSQSHLVFEIDAHHEVVDAYTGPKIMLVADLRRAPATQILDQYLDMRGFEFPKSGTVSNMLYNFARMLQPKQILLAGYDLCYTDTNNTHASGIRTSEPVSLIDGSAGGKFLQFSGNQGVEEAITVPTYEVDAEGNPQLAWTTKAYYTYLVEIGMRVRDGKVPTYDLSPKSARKDQVTVIDFAEFITTVPKLTTSPTDIINQMPTKKLRNNAVKHILNNPINGPHHQDIRYNHVTKIVYLLKQFNYFPLLKYGTVMHQIETMVVRATKSVMEGLVNRATAKWRKLNETDSSSI